jgi:peptide/nickel transport system permease protein
MLRYIIRRVLWGIALLFIVTAMIFLIFDILPTADPAVLRAGRNAGPAQIAQIRHALGLDKPIWQQFLIYMRQVFLHFDFGYSYQYNVPVRQLILSHLPPTILLVTGAAILWLAVGVSIGVLSATRRRSLVDRGAMTTSLAMISAPVFWLGLVALYLFASDIGKFPLLPGQGSYSAANNFPDRVSSMILPWLVLSSATAAIYARYMRASMIEVMSEDYIRTARAKGVKERTVVYRHGVRSAITPIVTLIGLDVGTLLAGNAILTETVFNIPGVGKLLDTSINRSDLTTIQGITLFGAFFIIFFNLIVDIAYAYLDPRVRYS